jgi:RNA polymerase sigma factor (sigma-70 family)
MEVDTWALFAWWRTENDLLNQAKVARRWTMENSALFMHLPIGEKSEHASEDRLVLNAKLGDLEAFNKLVLRYQNRIYGLTLRILEDEQSAEDITQNTFLTAYRSLSHFRDGSFRSWLCRIATNACYDELRRQKRHPLIPLEYENNNEVGRLALHNSPERSSIPEQEYERHEFEQTIRKALNRLDPDYRVVVVLVDLDDFTYKEVGQILRIPVGTVKSRLSRGRSQLRYFLRSTEHDEQSVYK